MRDAGPRHDRGKRTFHCASIECSLNTIKCAPYSYLLILQQNPTCQLTKNTVKNNCNVLQKSVLFTSTIHVSAQKGHHGPYINDIKNTLIKILTTKKKIVVQLVI